MDHRYPDITILTPIKWGVTWGLTHPWHTIGIGILLKNPNTRWWAIDHLVMFGRGAIAGLRGSASSTFTRLISPAARNIGPRLLKGAQVVAGSGAAPIVGAAVVAAVATAVVVAAQQKVQLVGPRAPQATVPFWYGLGSVQVNPFQMGWGSVV